MFPYHSNPQPHGYRLPNQARIICKVTLLVFKYICELLTQVPPVSKFMFFRSGVHCAKSHHLFCRGSPILHVYFKYLELSQHPYNTNGIHSYTVGSLKRTLLDQRNFSPNKGAVLHIFEGLYMKVTCFSCRIV